MAELPRALSIANFGILRRGGIKSTKNHSTTDSVTLAISRAYTDESDFIMDVGLKQFAMIRPALFARNNLVVPLGLDGHNIVLFRDQRLDL